MFTIGDKVLVIDNSYITCVNTGKPGLLVQGSMYGCHDNERNTVLTVITNPYNKPYYDKFTCITSYKTYINVISSNTNNVYAVWIDGCIYDTPKDRHEHMIMAAFDDAINEMLEDELDRYDCYMEDF